MKEAATLPPTGKAAPLPKGHIGRNAAVLIHFGTGVNSLFTIWPADRYTAAMMLLAFLAAAASPQPTATQATARAQATAMIRVISGTQLKLGEETEGAQLRQAQFRDPDGKVQPARLIEFH